jgi:hypothetical protein
MNPGQQIAIRLHADAAKLILGVVSDTPPTGIWFAVGAVVDMPSPIGLWVDISHFEERRMPTDGGKETKRLRYDVKPGQWLIRYEHVITIQNLQDPPPPPEDNRPVPGMYL